MFQCVAFDDIEPQAPVHFLVVPKKPVPKLSDAQDSDEKVSLSNKITTTALVRTVYNYQGGNKTLYIAL